MTTTVRARKPFQSASMRSSATVRDGCREGSGLWIGRINSHRQVVGIEVKSSRENRADIVNSDAEQRFKQLEQTNLAGFVRVKILEENRKSTESGGSLSIRSEVTVCVPKSQAVRKRNRSAPTGSSDRPSLSIQPRPRGLTPSLVSPDLVLARGTDLRILR